MRKLVFGVSDLVLHKPGCAVTEDGPRLEIWDLDRSGIVLYMALISCAVTALRSYCTADLCLSSRITKSRFSHNEAHLIFAFLTALKLTFQKLHIYSFELSGFHSTVTQMVFTTT